VREVGVVTQALFLVTTMERHGTGSARDLWEVADSLLRTLCFRVLRILYNVKKLKIWFRKAQILECVRYYYIVIVSYYCIIHVTRWVDDR
jgi:hypothetical protein